MGILTVASNPSFLEPFVPTNRTQHPFFSLENVFRPSSKSARAEWLEKKGSPDHFHLALLPHRLNVHDRNAIRNNWDISARRSGLKWDRLRTTMKQLGQAISCWKDPGGKFDDRSSIPVECNAGARWSRTNHSGGGGASLLCWIVP